MARDHQAPTKTGDNQAPENKATVPPTHIVIDPPAPPIQAHTETAKTQAGYWFLRPEWVIVFVTTIYVAVNIGILLAIRRQANTMEAQANDWRNANTGAAVTAKDTLAAIKEQAEQMKQQVEALNRQIGIAEKSVKATEENATAAAANAEATKRNVNVLIKGQRPWIVIDSLGAPPSLYEDRSEIPAPFDAVLAGIPFIVFNLKSVGDTVSKLVGTGSRFHLVPRKETAASEPEPALPDEPDYRIGPGALPQAGFVKAPNEGFQIANALEDGPILKDQIDAINDKTLFACAYGFVAYEDVFGEPHETRFCYVYRVSRRSMIQQGTGKNIYPSEFRLGGPDAYNRYT